MVSFQEMTDAQVTSYVAKAHELGARFLYSLNREKSAMNDELDSVTRIVSRYYWPREVDDPAGQLPEDARRGAVAERLQAPRWLAAGRRS